MVDETDIGNVILILGEITMESGKELTEYYITDVPESPSLPQDNEYEANMEIVFKRRLTNEAVMTFFPSLLLITISYATSFFKLPNFFNTAITVNVTVMLTTTTLLISVVKKLAPTSYIKWIEAWLIFAQLIPFTQVILITWIEGLKDAENIKEEERKKTNEEEPKYEQSKEKFDLANKLVKVSFSFVRKTYLPTQVHPYVSTQSRNENKKACELNRMLSQIG